MAKSKKKSVRHAFRRARRAIRRRKFTIVKGMKLGIALVPPGLVAWESFKQGGPQGAANALVKAYTGWDMNSRSFNAADAAVGYVPLVGAWLFGKVASRVLR